MSLDFATEDLYTIASCNCVCGDGFSVSNLNSIDQTKKKQGFQGERFVRTPVTVQFQFYAPINIQKIELCPFVGRQCAKVIQLWTSSTYALAKKEGNPSEPVLNRHENDGFRKAGTIVLSSPTRATFLNRGYKQHPRLNLPPTDADSLEVYTHGNLGCISALRISIQYMLNGSIPSLSSVRIWGRPARSCSSTLSKEIFKINRRLVDDDTQSSLIIHMYDNNTPHVSNLKSHDIPQGSEIQFSNDVSPKFNKHCPKEFIDPLTFEQMRAPVILPSGHTVDRTTLDKHIKSQSEMGNIASDPFTGIPFTSSSKPQPNMELKVRMDSYFFQQSKSSDINKNICMSTKRTIEAVDEMSSQISYVPDKKHKSSHSSDNYKLGNHSTSLEQSLNLALDKIQEDQSKTKLVANSKVTNSTLYCSKCNTFLSSDVVRYRLSCSHVMCYSCLKSLRNNYSNCPICSSLIEYNSVERIHI